jgi:hypothetical protein
MAGYSGTPLVKKLGIKEGNKIHVVNAPNNYWDLVDPLPGEVTITKRASSNLNMVHIFTTKRSELSKLVPKFIPRITQNGMIWISWPKKASKVKTDVTESVIREVALPLGLVDVKVCAVDETWSGLKVVIRKENRK